jgi:hypothetical protein
MSVVQLKPRPKRPQQRAAAAVAANSTRAAAGRANALSRRFIGEVRYFEHAFTGERRLNRQAIDEPSLAMSFVVLFVVLAAMVAMVAMVANMNITDVQLSTGDIFDRLS